MLRQPATYQVLIRNLPPINAYETFSGCRSHTSLVLLSSDPLILEQNVVSLAAENVFGKSLALAEPIARIFGPSKRFFGTISFTLSF